MMEQTRDPLNPSPENKKGEFRPDVIAFVIKNKGEIREIIDANWGEYDKKLYDKLVAALRQECNYSSNTPKSQTWKLMEKTHKRLFK